MHQDFHVGKKLLFVLTDTEHYISPDYELADDVRFMINDILDYILSDKRLANTRSLLESFAELPSQLASNLGAYGFTPNLINAKDLPTAELKNRLIQARIINTQSEQGIFMPFVDFINHDADGISYEFKGDAIEVKGKAGKEGEFFALYSLADSFHLLNTYFYPGNSNQAYSVSCTLELDNGDKVLVHRRFSDAELCNEGFRMPKIEYKDKQYIISHLWIGSNRWPRRMWWTFEKAWKKQGRGDALNLFNRIVQFNWRVTMDTLAELEGNQTLAANFIRQALMQQMSLMSQNLIEIKSN